MNKNKPLKDTLYDAILCGDEWKNLSKKEKFLRVTSALLIFPIPIMLVFSLHNEDIIEQAQKKQKAPREYKKEKNFFSLLKTQKSIINEKLQEQGKIKEFLKENKDSKNFESTEKGKKVNSKDKILWISSLGELTKKEVAIRLVALTAASVVFLFSAASIKKTSGLRGFTLFGLALLASTAFLVANIYCYFANKEERALAKEYNVSTTAMKVMIEEVEKNLPLSK